MFKMKIGVVAIERDDSVGKTVYGSSGIIIDRQFVLSTANILLPTFSDYFLENMTSVAPGKLHSLSHMKNVLKTRIICNNDVGHEKYEVKEGEVFGFFINKGLKSTLEHALEGWAVDVLENSRNLEVVLSLFVVIRIVPTVDIHTFENLLMKWWDLIKNESFEKSEEILVKSVPFGNKFFLNSFSKGIISNSIGDKLDLIVSDCPSTPGSEGSPVFKANSEYEIPVGMVISSSCWWRGEWTGLTLIADIRPILMELLENYNYKPKFKNISHQQIACIESSFVHVYCGSQRGTAILIDAKAGILLTNSHVVSDDHKTEIFWKNRKGSATLLYRTPNEIYDLALLKCDTSFIKNNNLHSIKISRGIVKVGDEVISVGFAIFSKNVDSGPTVSKGSVTQCSESMIMTTCCINPGMSGGAVLNKRGELVGIIVCNTKIQGTTVYPHVNMAIPYVVIERTIQLFLKTKDISLLHNLSTDNPEFVTSWKYLEAKL